MSGGMSGGNIPGIEPMPSGLSISVSRAGDGPTKINVKRGGETWEIVADDPAALAELPPEIRPFVDRIIQGLGAHEFLWRQQMNRNEVLPPGPMQGVQPLHGGDPQMLERMEQLEKRLQKLQEQMGDEK